MQLDKEFVLIIKANAYLFFRPGSKGFIVPDKNGKTNVLGQALQHHFFMQFSVRKFFNERIA